jgi:hypothetical protein
VKRTGIALPTALALAGAVLGWLLEVGLAAGGRPVLVPPYSLPVALVGIGAIVLAAGWPIRQAVQGKATQRLDPFRAMRVLLLAKASTLVGALLGGAAIGIAAYLLTRPVLPPASSLAAAITSVAAAVVLLICGLLVEHWCRVPPEDDDQKRRGPVLQEE